VGDLSEFPLRIRLYLRAYRWRRVDPVPLATLHTPLRQANVAIVTTAGLVTPEQPPFDRDVKGGDASFRVIGRDADVRTLIDTHRSASFDHAGIRSDANLAFPLDRLRELARDGQIGGVADRHLSFMGSITAPGRLMRDSAPAAATLLANDGVDVALLIPV
jgi:D-proline reductase (dithiol) PrdB